MERGLSRNPTENFVKDVSVGFCDGYFFVRGGDEVVAVELACQAFEGRGRIGGFREAAISENGVVSVARIGALGNRVLDVVGRTHRAIRLLEGDEPFDMVGEKQELDAFVLRGADRFVSWEYVWRVGK